MQTFLPFPDFRQSLEYLDNARLNKQIIETYQLCQGQWPNHPAAKMWVGYKNALMHYGLVNCIIAESRGINVNETQFNYFRKHGPVALPWWYGDMRFHESHRQNLHWKWDPVGVQPPYIWPIHEHEWRYIAGGVEILRKKKTELAPRGEYVAGKTIEGRPCLYLLQGYEDMPLAYKD